MANTPNIPPAAPSLAMIAEPRHVAEGKQWSLSSTLTVGESKHVIWFRTDAGPLRCGPEPFLAAALLPAAKLGCRLWVPGSASPRLTSNLPTILDIFHLWDRTYRRIPIEVQPRIATEPRHPGRACFFTAGFDSFYTLLKHRAEITTLVFVHGLDIRLDDIALRAKVSTKLQEVAAALGKTLIEVETNLKDFSERYVPWEQYHGAALASVALALSPHFGTIYIASSRCYADLSAWGSHPLVDPLWSSDDVAVIHDGCEATRLEKTKCIVDCDVVRRTLRVCWENPHGAYNCGRCTKCLWAKAYLRAIGALGRVQTFDPDLDLGRLARLPLDPPPVESTDLYDYVARAGKDPALAQSLRRYLDSWHHRGIRGCIRRGTAAIRQRAAPLAAVLARCVAAGSRLRLSSTTHRLRLP